eukprot:g76900.t1
MRKPVVALLSSKLGMFFIHSKMNGNEATIPRANWFLCLVAYVMMQSSKAVKSPFCKGFDKSLDLTYLRYLIVTYHHPHPTRILPIPSCPAVFLRHVSSTKVKPLSQPGGQRNPFPIPPPCSGKFPFTPLSSTLGNGLALLGTSYVAGIGDQGLSM